MSIPHPVCFPDTCTGRCSGLFAGGQHQKGRTQNPSCNQRRTAVGGPTENNHPHLARLGFFPWSVFSPTNKIVTRIEVGDNTDLKQN